MFSVGQKVWYRNYYATVVMVEDVGCFVKYQRGNMEVHRYCFNEELKEDLQLSFVL